MAVSNPEAEIIEEGNDVWMVAATPDLSVRPALEDGADFEEVRSLLVESRGEYSVVQVSADDELTIRAHRGITSAYDIYLTRASNGDVIVTDLFRNALSHLAVDDRTVTKDIIADHLLYRTTPTGSYVTEIDRLGHGETLRWKITSDTLEWSQSETLGASRRSDSRNPVGRLETAMERAISYDDCEDVVTMLSGGVDSTLLHTFLPSETPSTSAAFDAPEFSFEIDYAKEASALLDSDHDFRIFDESSFCTRLEDTIDAIGMPPQQLQSPTIDAAFQNDRYDTYVNGMLCDSLFGMGASLPRKVWWTRPLRYLPREVLQLNTHRRMAGQMLRSPWDPVGMAQQFSQYLPLEYVSEFVGKDIVERRQLSRLCYVRSLVPLVDAAPSFAAHMDWGHWIEFFCENTVNDYRQIAHARGKSMRAPFASTVVAELALSLPSPHRYVDGLQDKHVPKKLLKRRLPSYETDKPKGDGNLPESRYLREGPLVEAQEQYAIPEFVPSSNWADVVERQPGMGWILVSWAIWRDRVLREDDVTEAPSTRAVEVTTGTVA
jgi:asparagine synthase (glutamine-hydrolysing)